MCADSWESKILHFLHKPAVEWTLCGLLMLDVMILFVELFLGAQYPSCGIITREAVSCCPDPSEYCGGDANGDNEMRFLAEASDLLTCSDDHDDGHRFLAVKGGGDDYHHSVCGAGIETACPAGCDEHKYEWLHYVHVTFFSLTIAILGIFFVELCLVLICLKPKNFIKKPLYVLDLIVVTFSLILEFAFYFDDNYAAAALAGMLIITRLWRFVRVGHGIVMVTNKYHNEKNSATSQRNKELEDILAENGIDVPAEKSQSTSSGGSGTDKVNRKGSVQTAAADEDSDC